MSAYEIGVLVMGGTGIAIGLVALALALWMRKRKA